MMSKQENKKAQNIKKAKRLVCVWPEADTASSLPWLHQCDGLCGDAK